MSEELKPCPFCGGEAEMVSPTLNRHYVRCMSCEQQFEHGNEQSAIAVWNTRAAPSAVGVTEAREVAIWLKAALDCKAFVWDTDQHEAAEMAHDALQAALTVPAQGERRTFENMTAEELGVPSPSGKRDVEKVEALVLDMGEIATGIDAWREDFKVGPRTASILRKAASALQQMRNNLEAAEARNAELEAGLKPFAAAANMIPAEHDDDYAPDWSPFITVRAYRTARTLTKGGE